MTNKIEEIKKELTKAVEIIKNINELNKLQDLKVEFLGKKGSVTSHLKDIKSLEVEEKKEIGKVANEVKSKIESLIDEKKREIEEYLLNKKLEEEKVDLTLPVSSELGAVHPIEAVIDEQIKIFTEMGYEVVEGPEIETTEYIFDMLNTPKDHPARELQDTFYISDSMVLRSQTSAIQIRKMLEGNVPVKIICPGKVYRSDSVDATHSPVFHQMEGLVIGENVTMSDLKGTLDTFVKKSLGKDTSIRFRPHHFPYTEPSAEVDVTCFVCKGKGCSVCKKEGFIELLGCGMVHPKVLENCNIDSKKYSGFAFGFGIERIAMAKFNINDMRLLYENDVKFLSQFK